MSAPSTIGSTPSPITIGANQSSNDLYWTSPDPRDSGIIGYEGARPVFWRLATTMAYHNATRTVIYKGVDHSSREEEVAWFDWTSVNHLGRATIGGMELAMSELVQRGSTFRSRLFRIPDPEDQRVFEWRRDDIFDSMYQLYGADGSVLASFELYDVPQPSSIGPLYAVMRYWYEQDDNLMLTSILSISLIRWIALHGP
ncbi:unnamed protein product [Rhizoctonia solani]|uniref:Uncharacterized protein n=1 Tax=Rhizoctonia solani TaxID=456999 RepID=A0A8H3GPS4_9AGAM|nr:unnamed protein product [Rhizoctonia solani]CAE6507968.1 unnamed protein product [Rhizoctonia solani]